MKFYNVFSGNLSGKFREYYVKNQGDKVFNSLHSYWYFRSLPDEKILEAFEVTKGNIMIDSGAFTAYAEASMKRQKMDENSQVTEAEKRKLDIDDYVEKYIDWINKWDKYVTVFGQMDVIPSMGSSIEEKDAACQKTWDNFLYMYSKMNNPQKLLYTFHCGEDIKWLKQALEWRDSQGRQLDYIAIGGLVGKPTKMRITLLDEAFRVIKNSSNPNVKVHGFGVSSEKLWRKYPFESCDSFTPGMNANHGFSFDEHGSYRADDYTKIFKPRGKTEEEQKMLDELEKQKSPELLQEENDARTDEKTKLLVANIEYWTNLGNSISKPTSMPYTNSLFSNFEK